MNKNGFCIINRPYYSVRVLLNILIELDNSLLQLKEFKMLKSSSTYTLKIDCPNVSLELKTRVHRGITSVLLGKKTI